MPDDVADPTASLDRPSAPERRSDAGDRPVDPGARDAGPVVAPPPPPPPVGATPLVVPPLRGHAKIWWLTGPLLGLCWLATIVVLCLPAPYTTESPGSTHDTTALVTIQDGVRTYDHAGGFAYVTVSETNRPSFAQVLAGWLDGATDVFPTKAVVGDLTIEEDRRYAAIMMDNSKQSAAYQALSLLGYSPQQIATGVFVNQVIKGSPADGHLQAADVITRIDDVDVYNVNDLAEFMQGAESGQTIDLVVDRQGVSTELPVQVTLGSHEVDGEPTAYLGIYMETRPKFELPFSVEFDTGNVGGPSAGLALTLSLIDKLSPEGLAKGHEIAVTGTIQVDGTVGPIGGIVQKTHAVRESGADVFLVPEANFADAEAHAGSSLRVIAVTSLDQTLEVLRALPEHD